ncbi:flagellar basal-body rod protein FlgG [Desulfohalotomaculum tongense]|uniref:flagellar hook-basal body protein n=1 Tax=Desulforadius tongensis TaxID=1216062 RepID=UPI00195F0062|nr:flagellar hook-basal body complex protein [Desulforadius tongensis]MBM7854230.1 flagellar basal-body rod protein FlgG [Desulforadius tongensis]
MFRGIYTTLSGMDVQQARLNVITNNLANINSNGYKREHLISKTFGEYLLGYQSPHTRGTTPVGNLNMGSAVSQVVTRMDQGPLVNTGRFTDIALDGEGYYVVKVVSGPGGEQQLYTRESSFAVDNEGYLITSRGDRVLGKSGEIKIGSGEFAAAADGTITKDGKTIDQLQIVEFVDSGKLRKVGEEYFSATADAEIKNESQLTTQVRQGFVEKSNVDVVKEITDMITVLRTYEANQKMIQTQDELLGKAVNQVGRLRG